MLYPEKTLIISPECAIERAEAGELEAIAAITYSCNSSVMGENEELRVWLSLLSEFSVHAAERLAELTKLPIRIAGEHSYGPNRPSTAELMQAKISENILTNVIEKDRVNLINTGKQMQAHAEYMSDCKLLVVGLDFHLVRVLMHAKAFGLTNIAATSVEEIFTFDKTIQNYPELSAISSIAARERYIRLLTILDRKGHLLDLLAGIQGPRLHDIEKVDGEFVPIMSTTRKHFRELTGRKPDF